MLERRAAMFGDYSNMDNKIFREHTELLKRLADECIFGICQGNAISGANSADWYLGEWCDQYFIYKLSAEDADELAIIFREIAEDIRQKITVGGVGNV